MSKCGLNNPTDIEALIEFWKKINKRENNNFCP